MTAVILAFLYFIPNVKKKWDDNWPLPSIFFGYVIYPKPYKIQAKVLFGMTRVLPRSLFVHAIKKSAAPCPDRKINYLVCERMGRPPDNS